MTSLKDAIPTSELPTDAPATIPGMTPPSITPTPPVVETPAAQSESAKILETLQNIQDEMGGLRQEWDDYKETPPAPVVTTPAAPATQDTPPAWQPKSWGDFPNKARDVAKEVVQEELAAMSEAEKATQDAAKAEQDAIDKEINDATDNLVKKGLIPPVVNMDDPNDAGKAARRELYGLAASLDTMNLEMVANTMSQMHKQGVHYDFKTKGWVRQQSQTPTYSQNAPVGGSSPSAGGLGGGAKPDYDTIHKARSLGELAKRAGM